MDKLVALLALFRAGKCVEDPAKWKTRQITATALAPVLVAGVAMARAYGVHVPISDSDCLELAGGLVVVVNLVLTLTTSKTVGLGAANGARVDGAAAAAPAAGSDESSAPEGGVPPELHARGQATPVDPFGGDHGA